MTANHRPEGDDLVAHLRMRHSQVGVHLASARGRIIVERPDGTVVSGTLVFWPAHFSTDRTNPTGRRPKQPCLLTADYRHLRFSPDRVVSAAWPDLSEATG